MSMLSFMTDKLRKTASEVERIKHDNADWLWRDGVTLTDAATLMCDAADIIDDLRITCQDLRVEDDRLKVENHEMRKVIDLCGEYIGDGRCEGCVVKRACNDGEVDECWQLTEIRGLARELGIEVQDERA